MNIDAPLKLSLKIKRLEEGHSLRSLGDKLELTHDTVRRAEIGKPIRARAAKRLADFYDLRVSDIWDLEQMRDGV